MQTENFAPEKQQEQILKQIEKRDVPPAELAKEMLRQGDKKITELKSQIEDLIGEMEWEPDQEATVAQLKILAGSLDTAYREMQTDLRKAEAVEEPDESGWDIPESPQAESTEATGEELKESVDSLLTAPQFDFKAFETLAAKPEHAAELKEELTREIGPKFAAKLLEDPAYRKEMTELAESMADKLGGNGPEIMGDRNIKNLVVLHETLGPAARDLAEAMNFNKYDGRLDLQPEGSVIKIMGGIIDTQTGELTDSQVDFGMEAVFSPNPNEQRIAQIHRQFYFSQEEQPDGSLKQTKSVHHELLELPEAAQGNGIAAKITQECLKGYDKAGIDEITLHADIDKGGYTWASYGYGWDEDVMALRKFQNETTVQEMKNFDENSATQDILAKEPGLDKKSLKSKIDKQKEAIRRKAVEEAIRRYPGLGAEEKQRLLLDRVKGQTEDAFRQFAAAASETGMLKYADDMQPDLDELINAMESDQTSGSTENLDRLLSGSDPKVREIVMSFAKAYQHPEATTPNNLSLIGSDGPKFRKGESGTWYTEEAFKEAVASGADTELEGMRGGYHAGKIGLMNADWYGKIELKPTGAQKGANRKILEKVTARALAKAK